MPATAKKNRRGQKPKAAAKAVATASAPPAVSTSTAPTPQTPWSSRIVGHDRVDPLSLIPHPLNFRLHPEAQKAALRGSISELGFIRSVTVNKRTGHIVDGHERVEEAIAARQPSIDVEYVDLSEADEKKALALLDPISAMAREDADTLDKLLREVQTGDEAVAKMLLELGKDAGCEWAKEQAAAGGVVEDEVPEVPKEPVTKPGDLWVLGGHRLLCGDSTKADDVGRLMGGAKAEMMHADPPYGVNYEGGHHSLTGQKAREKLANDDSTDIYGRFLPVAMKVVDGPCYVWFAGSLGRAVYQAVEDAGGIISMLLIWHKTNATYAAMNAQYKQRHEPCLYFKPKGSTLRWVGPADACSLWEFKKEGLNKLHPTQKPVELVANAIRNHKAELIFDPFSGSGTTIIAAEQLNRRCYAMEISPAYCDVAVQRWEKLTGRKAVLATTPPPKGGAAP